jgi:translation elongation factor EF-1alpha
MDIQIGKVTHYYTHIGVAVLKLSGEIKLGDTIRILGHTTEFLQRVESLEIDHRKVQSAGPEDEVALQVWDYVRKGDDVFKVLEADPVASDSLAVQRADLS